MDARDFEPIKLENQLKDLALNYARHFARRDIINPTIPHPTATEQDPNPIQPRSTNHAE
jgi:hypothetical protein